MRTLPSSRRSSSPFGIALILLGTLLVGGFGLTGTLWAMGFVDLPFLRRPVSHAGQVGVPVLPAPLPAYTRLTREHFINPQTGKISYLYLAPDEADPRMILDLGKLMGRVLNRDKSAAYAFTETELFPKGTRPGIVGGIPPGKRSFVLDASQVRGVHALRQGDHFDLLATVPVDMQKLVSQGKVNYLATRDGKVELPQQSSLRVLVHNGVVVQAVTGRSASSDPKKGKNLPPIDEITLAIDPEELIPLTNALTNKANVVCVARSGHPDDPGEKSVTPDFNPLKNMRLLEEMRGFERKVHPVPVGPTPTMPRGTHDGGKQDG